MTTEEQHVYEREYSPQTSTRNIHGSNFKHFLKQFYAFVCLFLYSLSTFLFQVTKAMDKHSYSPGSAERRKRLEHLCASQEQCLSSKKNLC